MQHAASCACHDDDGECADVFGFWREGFAGGVVWLDSLESTDGWFDVSGSMHGTDGAFDPEQEFTIVSTRSHTGRDETESELKTQYVSASAGRGRSWRVRAAANESGVATNNGSNTRRIADVSRRLRTWFRRVPFGFH